MLLWIIWRSLCLCTVLTLMKPFDLFNIVFLQQLKIIFIIDDFNIYIYGIQPQRSKLSSIYLLAAKPNLACLSLYFSPFCMVFWLFFSFQIQYDVSEFYCKLRNSVKIPRYWVELHQIRAKLARSKRTVLLALVNPKPSIQLSVYIIFKQICDTGAKSHDPLIENLLFLLVVRVRRCLINF